MAVLNPTSALPGVARVLTNFLLENGPTDQGRLASLFSPPGLAGDDSGSRGVENTVTVGRAIGLFEVTSSELSVSLAVTNRSGGKPYELSPFRSLLRDLVLDVERDGDPWDNDVAPRTSGGRDLARALAWFLAQDASGPPLTWNAQEDRFSVQVLQSSQLREMPTEDRPFLNDTRWGAFTRWAPFLGLAEYGYARGLSQSGIGLVPFPLEAIREVVAELDPGELSIALLLGHLRTRLPVLGGGLCRNSLDRFVHDSRDLGDGKSTLDSPISQSLLCLDSEGTLQLEHRSDADRELLSDDEERFVSHALVRLRGRV
jgi:hypothetical protein